MAPRRSPVLVAETTGGGGSALTGSGAAEAAQGDGAVAEVIIMSERPRPEGYVDLVYGGYPTKGGEEEADM
uniref:Uncharacterized protein n=1 Tax=Oryza glaberrima TaxID=4538 RepID=I1R227_ORYGL